jgi:hypothetical protein
LESTLESVRQIESSKPAQEPSVLLNEQLEGEEEKIEKKQPKLKDE